MLTMQAVSCLGSNTRWHKRLCQGWATVTTLTAVGVARCLVTLMALLLALEWNGCRSVSVPGVCHSPLMGAVDMTAASC